MSQKLSTLIVFLVFLLIGCDIVPQGKITPTNTQTAISPTKIITDLPAPTQTMIPTQTATAHPTLMPNDAEEKIKQLLWDNPDCFAPCFMEIIPGVTTVEASKTHFENVGMLFTCELDDNKTGLCSTSHKFETDLSFYVRLSIKSGIVESLQIPVTLPENQNREARKEWSAIAPDTLIMKYGLPSKVDIFTDFGPTPIYAIDLYFDKNNLIASYSSYEIEANLKICPTSNRFDSMGLWMGINPLNPPLETIPLEKATSMTREEFSELLVNDSNGACFTLIREAFNK